MRALKKIKASKAPGLDKISGKLLIAAAGDSIIEPLMYLFNLVLNTGIFPDDMKLAKVTPIYKSGERTNCGNYKLISIISVVAKILEKIIYKFNFSGPTIGLSSFSLNRNYAHTFR